MKHLITILILAHCFHFSKSQVIENFNDGNLNSNPTWTGDTSFFEVNSVYQLQLNASTAGSSTITTAVNLSAIDTIEWDCYLELAFAPSSQNNTKVYLFSSQNNLSNTNAYYLQFGETGSNDAIQFFKQSGLVTTLLSRGVDGRVASAFGVSLKVVKYPNGTIDVYTDYTGGTNYQLEFSVFDSMNISAGYIGWQCNYTISNINGFYLDNIYVGSYVRDTIQPFLIDSKFINDSIIEIEFNEAVKGFNLNNNFHLLQSNNTVVGLNANLDSSIFQIQLTNTMSSGDTLRLVLTAIHDFNSNISDTIFSQLIFIRCENIVIGDLVISEVMCNPTGANNLPFVEYVELYNTSDKFLSTKFLTLSDLSSIGVFNEDTICPDCYVVFASVAGKLQLDSKGINAKVVNNFPTLNNDTDDLILKNATQILDCLNYTTAYYHDEFKNQGGWSIEKIKLDYMCANANNWNASCDARGGSPGIGNCSNNFFVDDDLPMVQYVYAIDSSTIQVQFSEEINSDSLTINDFLIDEQLNPIGMNVEKKYTNKITLKCNTQYLPNEVHTLQLYHIVDCSGNRMLRDVKFKFGVGVAASKGDLIINEIMFNPYDECVDFVEVYNKSDKIISLKNCSCCRRNSTSHQIEYNSKITTENLVMMPKDYLVLGNTEEQFYQCYPASQLDKTMYYELPAMNDDDGSILFLDEAASIIDELIYSEKQHSQLLNSREGVSLERINSDASTSNYNNWSSASFASGYATPTLKNSQSVEGLINESTLIITPSVFSPDNDGFDDHALIAINTVDAGSWSSVFVLDITGNTIKQLLNADLIGTNDKLIWDGTDTKNSIVQSGIYIISAAVVNQHGDIKNYRRPIVVAEGKN